MPLPELRLFLKRSQCPYYSGQIHTCRDRSVGDGMNGMNARGACVVEGWEYDKYSVSTHHTATSVTPDCSKDSPQKPA
jgi:hypothetical protein